MNAFGLLIFYGWIPAIFAISALSRKRHQTVILLYLMAWLFLPEASQSFKGLPDYTKMSATNVGVLLSIIVFDLSQLMGFRPRWYDLPMLIWCLCPIASSVDNGLGWYDGLSACATVVITWGIPYLIGRLYFSRLEAMRDLAVGVVMAAMVYVPLAIFEMRMSPKLHDLLYGFQTRPNFEYYGMFEPFGWRPLVFMNTSFSVAALFAGATLISFWLWRSQAIKRIWVFHIGIVFGVMLVMTLLCKVMSSYGPMLIGLMLLGLIQKMPKRFWLIALIAIPPVYMSVRASGNWSGAPVPAMVGTFSARRQESLQTRLDNEDRLTTKALRRPILGWGGWGRSRVYDQWGKDITLSDGLWVIMLGRYGLVGLVSLTLSLVLPVWLFTRRIKPKLWSHPSVAPMTVAGMLLALHMIDNLPNAFVNPIFYLMAGGLAGCTGVYVSAQKR